MKKQNLYAAAMLILFSLLLVISYGFNFSFSLRVGKSFIQYLFDIMKFLPFVFILTGLFEAWIKCQTIEKHLGRESGYLSFFWAVLLGGTTVGPMIVALPVASALYGKGARTGVVFAYFRSASVCRIPMTMFETSYLGIEFTIVRYMISLPLIIIAAILLEKYINKIPV